MPVQNKTAPTQANEPLLNGRLGELLKQEGLSTESEYSKPGAGGARIDVHVELPEGLGVAVECKNGWSSTARSQVVKDAQGREGLAGAAVAVCYPDGLARADELCFDTEILMCSVSPDWQSVSEWSTTTPEGLAAMLRRLPQEKDDPDAVAKILKDSLALAADMLSDTQRDDMAKALGLPEGDRSRAATIRALLVVAAAGMFHARLDEYLPSMKPDIDARDGKEFSGSWPPKKLQECCGDDDPIKSLEDTWGLILAVDYKPVFETAITAIKAPSQTLSLTEAVQEVIKTVMQINRGRLAWRHDILGRIFHRVLDSARYDGSFYTSTAAATLLAGLAIPPLPSGNIGGGCSIQDLRIVDPACGTGTLLMAAAERLQDIANTQDRASLGKAMVENILHGYDINLTATHMAATTLGLISPEVKFQRMNIHKFIFGIENNTAQIGSLELYDGQARLAEWPTSKQVDSGQELDLKPEPHDLVVMNPPFTRDSLRYDQFTKAEEKQMKDREEQIFRGTPTHRSNAGGMFLLLADKLANSETGCIAVVLAASAAGAPSSKDMWKEMLKTFWVEIVVASHDPKRMFFSENTKISEILLVLRRRGNLDCEPPDATYIRLSVNPESPIQAIPIYNAYHNGEISDQPNVSVCEWPQRKLRNNNWLPSKFFSNYLVETVNELFTGGQMLTRPLGDIAEVNPDGRGVRDFDKSPVPDGKGYQALWNNNTKVTYQMLLSQPDTYIIAKPGNAKRAEDLWKERGRLLIPTRFSTPSMLLGAVWSKTPILGSGWVPVKRKAVEDSGISEDNKEWEKAVCVWLNSTLGVLAQMLCITPKKLVYPAMSIDGQKRIPTPDFTPQQATRLAEVFDAVSEERFERLRNPDAAARETLDHAIAETLGIPKERIDKARRELAKEPSVTNKRYSTATP